jgi:hypothetical protein
MSGRAYFIKSTARLPLVKAFLSNSRGRRLSINIFIVYERSRGRAEGFKVLSAFSDFSGA